MLVSRLLLIIPLFIKINAKYCFVLLGDDLYDFSDLDKENQFEYQNDSQNTIVIMNVCSYLIDQFKDYFSYGILIQNSDQPQQIGALQQKQLKPNKYKQFKQLRKIIINQSIHIEYPQLNSTNRTHSLKGIELKLECNQNEPNYRVQMINVTSQIVVIQLQSKSGCPQIEFTPIWKYLNKYQYIFGSLCVLMGMVECFYGNQLKRFNLFSSGYGAFFCLIMVIYNTIYWFVSTLYGTNTLLKNQREEIYFWLLLLSANVVSVMLGYLTMLQDKLSSLINGGWLGFVIGLMVYNLGLYNYEQQTQIFFYLVPSSLALIMALLELTSDNYQIISSSVVGAYFTVRGLSFFIGFYPNEFEVAYLVAYQQNLYESIVIYYPYCAAIVILSISGLYMQFKQKYYNQQSMLINSGDK